MTFRWPAIFFLLLLLPLLITVYIWVLKKKRGGGLRYSSLSLVRRALPRTNQVKQHLPFGLLIAALASLIAAMTGPTSNLVVPVPRTAIILAIDVSLSMCTTDILPNRLEAAKEAALAFIDRQDPAVKIGVVGFAGFAVLIQEPTTDKDLLRDAIESLAPARRTAIGSAILTSLDAISEVDDRVDPVISEFSDGFSGHGQAPDDYLPHIVVLLTDGVTTSGIQPVDAANFAVSRGVRIYPIGFGTSSNSFPFDGPGCEDMDFLFGGIRPPNSGANLPLAIDEITLNRVAEMTGGAYYAARSAGELQDVFQDLPTFLITEVQQTNLSVILVAAGVLTAGAALALGFRWRALP